MANNVTLPGTGVPVESIDIGSGVERQVVTVGDRAGGAVDSIGGLTETAPATDTASSGLNGRLQRIAQRLTTLIGSTLAVSNAGTFAVQVSNANSNGQTVMSSSAPIVVASNQSTLSIANDTSVIMNGATGTTLTPKFAIITASSSGATTIVPLVTSKKIRVLQMVLTSNGTVNVKWQSHVTPTDKTGLFYEVANTGYTMPFSPVGWFETVAGEALDINLSGAVAVGGVLAYVEV